MLNETFQSMLAALPSTAHDRLIRLLPLELQDRVRPAHGRSDEDVVAVSTHLSRLCTALRGAVPQWLLTTFDRDKQIPLHGIDSTILLADVTGFTQLTKQLEVFGHIGNEYLTDAINQLFTLLVATAYAHGGDVLAFGGDAILVAFTGIQHATDALYATWDMQAALDAMDGGQGHDTRWQYVQLQIKIGLAGGPIMLVDAGSEQRRVALALGTVFNSVDTITNRTAPGTIRLDTSTASATASIADFCQQADGDMLLRGIHAVPGSVPAILTAPRPSPRIDLIHEVLDLAAFVPHDLLDTLVSKPVVVIGDGEQRDVISMCIHLVGLHELSDACRTQDPSVLTACATIVMKSMIELIERYGGVLARIDTYAPGHKILALFGAPIARERAAERSICAALALREELPSINQCLANHLRSVGMAVRSEAQAITVSVRIGMQAGRVVAGLVGSPQRWEYTVLGNSINIAARLMANADLVHHEILLGPDVYSQAADLVQAASRQLLLKGMEQPIIAWSIDTLQPARRWQPRQVLPLTGREAELRTLQGAATTFRAGKRTTIIVQGAPGIGKTRLVHELPAMLAPGSICIETRASGTVPTPFGGIRTLIAALCQTTTTFDATQLRAAIQRYCPDKTPTLWPILSMVMGWHHADSAAWGTDSETQQRVAAWAVHELLMGVATQRPLAWLWEDVHDVDEVSLALLEHMLAKDWEVPFLWCLTLRTIPDSAHPVRRFVDTLTCTWSDQILRLSLSELNADASGQLLDACLPGLAQRARAALFAHTNGNPLFLEVLAQTLRDRHLVIPTGEGLILRADLAVLGVPGTVREVIAAQVDCLPANVRYVASAMAVATEAEPTVAGWLLEHIVEREADLEMALHSLEQALIILRVDATKQDAYTFRHALYQRTIYDRLLDKERRALHRATGQILHTAHEADQAGPIDMLAFHCYEGQLWDLAATYSLQAGRHALQVYANRTARRLLRRALGLARRLGAPHLEAEAREGLGELYVQYAKYGPARAQFERALAQAALADNHRVQREAQARQRRQLAIIAEFTGEYTLAEQECRTALTLLQDVSPTSIEVSRIYEQLAVVLMRRGRLSDAEQVCRDGLKALPHEPVALRERVDLLLLLGTFDGQRGHYQAAIPILEQSLSIARSIGDPARISPILCNLGLCLYYTGQWERARICYEESLLIDERIDDAVGRVRTINNLGLLDLMSGAYDAALRRFGTCRNIAGRLNMRQLLADASSNLGQGYYMLGAYEQAMSHLLQAQALFCEFGDIRSLAECLVRLGDTALAHSNADAALNYGEQSLAHARNVGSDTHEARALRLIGEALLRLQQVDRAAPLIEHAHSIQARVDDPFDQGLLLRAEARLALEQGNRPKARVLVQAILDVARTYKIPYLLAMAEIASQEIDGPQFPTAVE